MADELLDVGAVLSDDGVYRYWLGRVVPQASLVSVLGAAQPRRVLFVMLNPSTASHTCDDPTIRRLLGYARAWDFARVDVVNLFGFRTPRPAALAAAHAAGGDVIGPRNDAHITAAARRAHAVVVAWGGAVPRPLKATRPARVLALLAAANGDAVPQCLARGVNGTPKHPLYQRAELRLRPFVESLTIDA